MLLPSGRDTVYCLYGVINGHTSEVIYRSPLILFGLTQTTRIYRIDFSNICKQVCVLDANIGNYPKVEDYDTLFLCSFAIAMRMTLVL